jgi:aldose sugar dehydrogenase
MMIVLRFCDMVCLQSKLCSMLRGRTVLNKLLPILFLSGVALLSGCGAQPDDAKSTTVTSKTTSQNNNQAVNSATPNNTEQTSLMTSLAQLYPSGQVPEGQKAQLAQVISRSERPTINLIAAGAEQQVAGRAVANANASVSPLATPADYLPVTRIQNTNLYGAYFFTIYDAERAAAMAANPLWRQEGAAFWAAFAAGANLSPVHRFRSLSNGSHLFTIYESERANIIANYAASFAYEGVAWYAQQTPSAGWSPLYRFRNKTNGTYLFSAYEAEKNAIVANYAAIFELEGIAFYVRLDNGNPAPRATLLNTTLASPWGMAFLPDGRILVTQKAGTFVIVSADGLSVSASISPTLPNLVSAGQGGLLDVVLDPDFNLASNPRIYWTFSESGTGGSGTAVARGNLVGSSIQNASVIYRQTPKVSGDGHFGSRLAFRSDKTLFVTLGERQLDDPANPTTANAQSLTKTLGKVIRINRDGTIPTGNPNFGVAGALPEIWSYGHRNPQGAAIKPGTDDLWLTEHGPRGGDELNRVLPGRNYGWPLRSYGCPYTFADNVPSCWVNGGTHAPSFEEPKAIWLPNSTAPAGLMFYTGTQFNDLGWQGNVFTGSLAGTTLWRVVLTGDNVVMKEEVAAVKNLGQRIRAVKQGPDGWIYLLTDGGQLVRIER